MKKYINKIILSALSIATFSSCQNELDTFNDNPNDPIITTPSLLLASMEVTTFGTHTSGVVRLGNIFDQHLTGTDIGQLGPYTRYVVTEGDILNEWNTIYGTTLISGHILNRDFADDYPYYNGIGQVLSAISLGYATDMWGDVPYDEAFLGDQGNITPKYNTQQEIYARLQTILDAAIVNLKKPESSNVAVPEIDDFIFNGDTEKWIKIAYVLKARYALRLTERDTNAAQNALDYITLSGMTSNDDDANTYFPGTANGLNQWYAFEVSRTNYLKMGALYVDNLATANDPRLPFVAAKNKAGGYSGNATTDLTTTTSSYIGSAYASATSAVGIVTYAEAKFIEAEAQFRLANTTAAKTALENGVKASVLKITGTDATAAFVAASTATVNLSNIIQQKYNALFLTLEPYNDYRRTGFPALVANPNGNITTIPVRVPTPSDERNYNPNATVVTNLTTKVWWDNN
ncbi:SusD/RagB family nutrient-binding outer membrane lipoprotein [Flavobacterium algicola]|uniref:SusD/RagB family nutrient-binding outer membrane lipoprotein n=1 Tax=Flavobacterium algicola TaxID=556529 RepID=UPI001EFECFC6|nr:SusD/RagB family nutrient-binding outer membrane lipoprotein [Flavobacterium algicola]MCG9793984.1 SusD/RagB family nutrient-binding outer membrane lipoprotein [Flavobacterium algicola]